MLTIGFLSCGEDDAATDNDCEIACINGGQAIEGCICACPEGFSGNNCENEEFICELECQNGGTVSNECDCECPLGFSGENCENCTPSVFVNESFQNQWISTLNVNLVNDVYIELPDNYIMTGFGNNGINTMMLKGRELFNDGTLGEELEFRDGTNPTGPLEISYIVPDGHVITGIGIASGINGAIDRLVVNYNEIKIDDACDLKLGPELLYDNGQSTGVELWLKVSDYDVSTETTFFGGFGLEGFAYREVEAEFRELFNSF